MSPYERAWRRAHRTGVPALYFERGRWRVASVPRASAGNLYLWSAWNFAEARA